VEPTDLLTIGEVAQRSGVATSALRFYEAEGLISAERTSGNQRRFRRSELRRVALIRAAQTFGLSLEEIRDALGTLPPDRTPTKRDWERLARVWRSGIDGRIASLRRLRDEATSCIGCGCLSLRSCALLNAGDVMGRRGSGARYLLGDEKG
jgi:MerR family redox-sensitive transcriptional activator SoxR